MTIWPLATSVAQPGARLHLNTLANNAKSNQSRVWLHDGKWWAIAPHTQSGFDFIWRYNATTGTWFRTVAQLDSGAFNRYDVVLDASTGELAVLRSHHTTTTFYRFTYTIGTGVWTLAIARTQANFGNSDNGNPCTLVKAKNGEFWMFRIDTGRLQARKSSNGGANWSGTINIKTGLNAAKGTADAVSFMQSVGGLEEGYVGVAYGEVGATGLNTVYGFLYHRDFDPNNLWTDESNLLTLQSNEKGNNQLSLAIDPQNLLYLFTRNFGGTGNAPRNTLYKRLSAGVWKKYAVNSVAGVNWNSPAVAIDTSNGLLVIAGTRSDSNFVEYKCAPLGSEPALAIAQRNVLLARSNDDFQHLSLPRQYVNQNDGMLATAGNTTENRTWFNRVFKAPIPPVLMNTVVLLPNQVNAQARYTINLTLTDPIAGALPAGFGKVFVKFSSASGVPDTILAQYVKINGVAAAVVTAQPQLQQLTITTPVDLAGNAAVSIEIDSTAGILNAHNVGNDSLSVWTSSQPAPSFSPAYQLVPATTKVTAAIVTVTPNNPSQGGNYTIGFRLGAHGRMFAGQDTFYVKFPAQTTIVHGALTNAKVNGVVASAQGDNVAHIVAVILPAAVNLANQDSVTIFLPATAMQNPATVANYTLSIHTNVEPTPTVSRLYPIGKISGSAIAGTAGDFSRGNQSKIFYHGGKWWLAGLALDDNNWYLWKYNGVNWVKALILHDAAKVRPDMTLNASANKLYILFAGGSTTELLRLTYAADNWSMDAGYPSPVNNVQNDEMNLVRAKNGNLWVFWIADFKLFAQRSNNEGNSWFTAVVVKNSLTVDGGLTDAVAFTVKGANAIGVGYAENSSHQSSRFGFIYHRDDDAGNVWTDESGQLGQPIGTSADNHINMATFNNQVFMVVKTNGGGASAMKNVLYVRRTNNTWARFVVIQGSDGWTRPVLAIDATYQVLYVFGVSEGTTQQVEMKRVPFGQFASLPTRPRETALCFVNDVYFDISMPPHNVTAAMGLPVVAQNETRNRLWHRELLLGALPKSNGEDAEDQPELAAERVEDYALAAEVYPNPFNPSTTIRFRLREAAPVKLQIFNISGQLVRTLVDEDLPAGEHLRQWNARNHRGEAVATGTYLYRLRLGARLVTGQMQLLK
ncbi:MAG: FlgD immunoglobulin-like domain containing protein [bacterium]